MNELDVTNFRIAIKEMEKALCIANEMQRRGIFDDADRARTAAFGIHGALVIAESCGARIFNCPDHETLERAMTKLDNVNLVVSIKHLEE